MEPRTVISISTNSAADVNVNEPMKKCSHCGKILPLSAFYNDKRKKDGHQSVCKKCNCEAIKERKNRLKRER